MHARGDEEGVVGVAIGLFDACRFFAVLGDGLVAFEGVEIDARFHDVEGEEGGCYDQWDGEGARDWEDLAEAECCCGVAHCCESFGVAR